MVLILIFFIFLQLDSRICLNISPGNRLSKPSKVQSSSSTLQMALDDDDNKIGFKDSSDGPKFGIKSLDDIKSSKSPTYGSSSSKSESTAKPVKRSATFGSLTVEDLKSRMIAVEAAQPKDLPKRTEDLNGINPLIPLFSSVVPFGMAFLGYKLSSYFALNFAVQFLDSNVYTVQRLAIVARNILVGLTTLATTFSFVIGMGLLLLGLTVGVGVLKGELDPNKKPVEGSQVNEDGTFSK